MISMYWTADHPRHVIRRRTENMDREAAADLTMGFRIRRASTRRLWMCCETTWHDPERLKTGPCDVGEVTAPCPGKSSPTHTLPHSSAASYHQLLKQHTQLNLKYVTYSQTVNIENKHKRVNKFFWGGYIKIIRQGILKRLTFHFSEIAITNM